MPQPHFSLIVIRTREPEALLPFYNAIGLEFVREQHGSGPVHFSCTMGEVVMEIYPPKAHSDEEDMPSIMLGFKVDALDEVVAKLHTLGAHVGGEPKVSEWGRWCNAFDLDGRTVQLTERGSAH